MPVPSFLILRAAGTNCDAETLVACEKAGATGTVLHVNRLLERPGLLDDFHGLIIPGGFSYGDDLGAGRIFANELRLRLRDPIRRFIGRGRLVLGICNGFQVLTKAGLLPDPDRESDPVTLGANDSNRFEARWVRLKVCSSLSEFIKEPIEIELPVAHGEGKFIPSGTGVLETPRRNSQVILAYVGPDGQEGGYPWNPNGSVGSVAGISDPTGRVLGLMPHPERHADRLHHPAWPRRPADREPDGLAFFRNAADYVKRKL